MTRYKQDLGAVILLIVLWVLFFWRMLLPIEGQQISLTQGDFSGQFVTFGAYQYERFSSGEVPLWNPYNNGGLPFIADTQAAVFYPPRLLTIALTNLTDTGWTYHTLEVEMMFHVLFYTLSMYLLLRRMTFGSDYSVLAGLIAAIIAGYSGYITGYPPLQLALLEAGIWLPLAILGIFEATRDTSRFGWRWLIFSGAMLGLSWMAGHPQTSWFLTYLMIAYLAYKVWQQRFHWSRFVLGTMILGMISVGAVAVTLLPGLEYLILTSRNDMSFEEMGGGFPIQDFTQILYPYITSQWSPLYIGIIGLILGIIAAFARVKDSLFWIFAAIFALVFSLGANGGVYNLLYDVLPGLRYFRGQERIAYLYANSLAILAGYGVIALTAAKVKPLQKWSQRSLWSLAIMSGLITLFAFVSTNPQIQTDKLQEILIVSTAMLLLYALLIPRFMSKPRYIWILVIFIVAELFFVNIRNSTNYDPIPPEEQIVQNPLLNIPLSDTDQPFRVDGKRVLTDNYGSYYGLADIHGISPLFLNGVQQIIEESLPDERAWELFSVRYVYSDWQALPVPWELLESGADETGQVNLFELTAQRPYAHLVYDYVTVNDDEEARLLLADPEFDARNNAILHKDIDLELPQSRPDSSGTTIIEYLPEKSTVIVNAEENAILSLAHVDYPGWYATIDGEQAEILRAYGGLSALPIPAGEHTVELVYNPLLYRIGAIISGITWLGLASLLISTLLRNRKRHEYKN